MKKIERIDEEIKTYEGESVIVRDKDGKEINLTAKKVLLNLLGTAKGKDGEECIKILNMGIDLNKADKEWEFYEEDEVILKKIINENLPQYFSHIIGIVYKKIKEAKAFKK